MKNIDLSKTLDELEGVEWGEPTFHSALVIECHRLRKVPLKEFTVGNLRVLIGQKISLEYLVPLALQKLGENPFVMGNFYQGDLLVNVLGIPNEFWTQHQELYWQL
jgi:CDI immunity proteins